MFRDDDGRAIRFSDLFEGRPLILVLGYFHCARLCGVVRADLFEALHKSRMIAGRDYSLAVLSIDPSETVADAGLTKANDLRRYPAPGEARYWHFLTGNDDAVQGVADAVGFHDRANQQLKTFGHPIGLVFLTPTGVVSNYLLGVGYQPDDVRRAVTRAASGDIAPASSPVMLLCYDFDPTTGRYTLAIVKLMRWAAAISVAILGGALFHAFRRERSRA